MKQAFLLLFGWVSITATWAQPNPARPELCQGKYFEEAEAVQIHKDLARSFSNKKTWEKRKAQIKKGIIAGAELELNHRKKADHFVMHSLKTLGDYTVANVSFQSLEGIYVTGNLYAPTHITGSMPGILAPHGHGPDPRYKAYVQQRCATLARMGAYVLAYDMIGAGDSKQCKHKIEKAFKLQCYNSMAALDFLETLPNIDKKRLAITGESGGGTQTFMLAALDPRIMVSVPVVMVSGHFFGGCECESGMPVHKTAGFQTSNLEIAACFAPKPLLLVSDGDDWTKNTPDFEYPYIQNVYQYYKAKAKVENVHLANEKHDYGPNKRLAAYKFLAKYLKLDLAKVTKNGEIDEAYNTILTEKDLKVFDESHPLPLNALMGDEAVSKLLN